MTGTSNPEPLLSVVSDTYDRIAARHARRGYDAPANDLRWSTEAEYIAYLRAQPHNRPGG